jgi:hypothetical protein
VRNFTSTIDVTTSRAGVFVVAIGAAAIVAGALSPIFAASRPMRTDQASSQAASAKPRTDNLVALEMGGRFENQPARPGDLSNVPERALDGIPRTMWATLFPPETLVLSFI